MTKILKLGDVSGNLGEKPRGITGICSANLLNKGALAAWDVGVRRWNLGVFESEGERTRAQDKGSQYRGSYLNTWLGRPSLVSQAFLWNRTAAGAIRGPSRYPISTTEVWVNAV